MTDSQTPVDPAIDAAVRARLAPGENDPQARLALRREYYTRHGFGQGFGYGSSELEFLEWEVERGVLNPMTTSAPGSPWWRAVNMGLMYDAEYAAALFEANDQSAQTGAIGYWLGYLRQPSSATWYGAHNSSIARGYLANTALALNENKPEQIFINIVLYRVLFAQAMVEGQTTGPMGGILDNNSRLNKLQKIMSDPRLPSVAVLVRLPSFYPLGYPLTRSAITRILGLEKLHDFSMSVLFDNDVVGPGLQQLYRLASQWLDLPQLQQIVVGETPVYPNQHLVYASTQPGT